MDANLKELLSHSIEQICDIHPLQQGSMGSGGIGGVTLSQGEVRVTDPETGGQKGSKLATFSLIPSDLLYALAEHYGKGMNKYSARNWEKGYKWSLSLDAAQRHLHTWILGEDDDPETGSSHLVASIWHLIALWWFHRHRKGTDDLRPPK